jgi:hypothetical protein
VHWNEDELNEISSQHPFPNSTYAVNPQQLQTTLLQNSFHGLPPLFPPVPSSFNHQQLSQYQHTPAAGSNFFIPNCTFQQPKTLWNTNPTPNPFHASTATFPQRNSTRDNPFGTKQA